MDPLRALLVLARAPALTALHVQALARGYSTLAAALSLPPGRLSLDEPLPAPTSAYLSEIDSSRVESDLAWVRESGVHVLSVLDRAYPPLLRNIRRPPPVLFVLGNPAALARAQLAIVGSRNPTAAGRGTARDFAACFSAAGLTITSGLALGIDTAAHEGALLRGGCSVAVCGTGLDIVYPPSNKGLAQHLAQAGAVVSEFPPGTPPLRAHFPQRNRIISGLSLGTLVIEAARGSGSLITAEHALEQGREVFAIPGSIHNPLTRGCHQLIRDGAKLVEAASDVLDEINFPVINQLLNAQQGDSSDLPAEMPALDKEYEILLDALGFEPASIDNLTEKTGLAGGSVASMLLILELEGRVAPQPGGRYCRVP